MNCVYGVVIFFYLSELTPKTQVFKAVNTVGISSNTLIILMQNFYQHSILSAD